MKEIVYRRNDFMELIQTKTSTQLNDRGINFSATELSKHFIDMMDDKTIQQNVTKVFLKRFEVNPEP